MEILHLIATPFWSGPLENVAQLALAQRRLGHRVWIAIDRKRSPDPVEAEEPAVPRLSELGLLSPQPLELSVKSWPSGWLRDLRALKKGTWDVLHCHLSHDHWLARWGRKPGTRLIRSFHVPRSVRKVKPDADAYTVPFRKMAAAFTRPTEWFPALVDGRYVPAADRRALKHELGMGEGPIVGMVSTFQKSRRHLLGVEAFAHLRARRPDVKLALIGDGAELGNVRRVVAEADLTDAVVFAGYQSGNAFVRWLQAIDEVWVLGLGNDFSGRAAAQARACGARVVAVDEGALADYADQVLAAPEPGALLEAALGERRTDRSLAAPQDVARAMIALYQR